MKKLITILLLFSSFNIYAQQAGNALDFDGTNDYVEVPDNSSLDLTTNYTIEAWIKPESFSWLGGIVSKYHTPGSNGYLLRLHSDAPYTGLCFDEMYTSTGILETGTWYHIAAVNDNGTRKLYLNGVEQTLTGTPLTVQANSDPLRFGVDYLSSARYFDGEIEEVRIWNTARNSVQIRENMHRTLDGTETGLVSYWQFNEGSGITAFDVVNANNGTLNNMTDDDWVTSTAPLPFASTQAGDWTNAATWLSGQGSPIHTWSRVKIDHAVTLNTDRMVIGCEISAGKSLSITSGTTLTVSNSIVNAGTQSGDGLVKLSGTDSPFELAGVFSNIELDDTDGATLTEDLTINVTLTLTSGIFTVDAHKLTIKNVIAGTPANLVAGITSSITIAGSGSGVNIPSSVSALNNMLLDNSNGTILQSDLLIDGTLTLTSGVFTVDAHKLTIKNAIGGIPANLVAGITSSITIAGSGSGVYIPSNVSDLNNMVLNNSNGTILQSDLLIDGTLTLTSGIFTVDAHKLTIKNAIAGTPANLVAGITSSITIAGSGSGVYIPSNVSDLNNMVLNNSNGTILQSNLLIDGTMTLSKGTLTTNGYALSYGPDGTLKYNGTSLQTTTSNEFPSTNNPKNLIINNAAGVNLSFNRTIDSTLILTNGDLDLNGDTLTLGVNATLSESVGNTVKGNSGIIITTRTFNAGDLSTGVNIAGMGAGIMTDSALGETTIIRGHVAQSNGNLEGILRYYDISPANNSGLYGTLTFYYDDTEMNGILSESLLKLFRSTDTGNTWTVEGGTVNTANNTIILSGINAFSRWTAFNTGFTEILPILYDVYNGSVAWGDYDNDGDLDILLTGNSISRVYDNCGGYCNFMDINAGLPGVYYSSAAWGDYDNDGDLDILLTGSSGSGSISRIYRNDGSGIFTDINAGLPGVWNSSVAWGDYDNDGDLDILLTGLDENNDKISCIYRNDGSGIFTDINAGLPGVWNSSVAWGNYDNDGDLDILLTGWSDNGNISRVYRNDGSGTFTDINAGLTGVCYSSVAWGDYDNDGDLDILLTGLDENNDKISCIYHNINGNFSYIAELPSVESGSAAWGDYDNDGDLDILLTGLQEIYGKISCVYRNDGSGAFTDINAGLTGVSYSSVAWGDYDNDGDLDILLTGSEISYPNNNAISRVYRNNIINANTAPDTPANIWASVSNGKVNLSWDISWDNETPRDGLTYNLRIGTSSGGVQTASPMANVYNGYRKVAALGNTNHNNNWHIDSLSCGKYYWSVQSVDNAFAGSAFATEGSFVIGDPPNITTTNITSITTTTASSGGNVTDEGNFPVTVKGIVWDTIKNPTVAANMGITNDGSGIGSFTSSLTGLSGVGQTYYVRAYATNSECTAYGGQKIFATPMIPPGNALDFDGINDYVETGLNDLSGSEITIEYWFKGTSTQSAVRQQNGDYIVAGWNDLHIISTDGGTGTGIAVGPGAEDGNWHHIAMSWQQNTVNGFKSYLDGNLVAQRTSSDISLPNIDANVILGSISGTQEFMYGTLDEVRIWNVALDSNQIRVNMHRTLNGDEANLVAYYRFDHISGTVLSDRTSNDNDGTLYNMDDSDWVTSTAPAPFFTVGNGIWETESTWATGQTPPVHPWSRVMIKHNITLNSNMELMEMIIDTTAIMTISTGDTLIVGEE